jgi:hypothetical protein
MGLEYGLLNQTEQRLVPGTLIVSVSKKIITDQFCVFYLTMRRLIKLCSFEASAF